MPFANGIFTRVRNWVADKASGLDMQPDLMDQDANDIANALSNCVTRDGQGMPGPGVDLTRNLSQLGSLAQALGNLGFGGNLSGTGHLTIPCIYQGNPRNVIVQWLTLNVTGDTAFNWDIPFPFTCLFHAAGIDGNNGANAFTVTADGVSATGGAVRPRYVNQGGNVGVAGAATITVLGIGF